MAGGFDVLFANTCMFFRTTGVGRHIPLPSVLYLQEPFRWLYEALPRLRWASPPANAPRTLRGLRRQFVDWRNVRNWRVQAREEAANAAAFTRILVNWYFSRESVLRAYGLDAQVCYLGIDGAQFRDAGLPREDYVVGLGSCTPEKNVGLVIEAIGAMPEPRPRLVWVGNIATGTYQQQMVALAADRGVALEFRIGIPDAALHDVLGRAMSMVYAPRLEPFGLAPLEANAAACQSSRCLKAACAKPSRTASTDCWRTPLRRPSPRRSPGCGRPRPRPATRRGRRRLVEETWSLPAAAERLERHMLEVAGAPAHNSSLRASMWRTPSGGLQLELVSQMRHLPALDGFRGARSSSPTPAPAPGTATLSAFPHHAPIAAGHHCARGSLGGPACA